MLPTSGATFVQILCNQSCFAGMTAVIGDVGTQLSELAKGVVLL